MNEQLLSQTIAGKRWPRVGYRLRQFFQGLSAQIAMAERQAIAQLLPTAAVTLFERMPIDAQRHSLNVLYTLQAAGRNQPALAQSDLFADLCTDLYVAALLHDVGKVAAADAGVHLGLWLRGPLVMLEALAPALFNRLASADPQQEWRYALYVQREHPHIGARWAKQAGCTAEACWLIEHHQATRQLDPHDPRATLLLALQQADGNN